MTNYADMPAGPEMDRLVAEKVMGWAIKRHYQPEGMIFHAREDDAIFVDGKMKWWANAWSPSTNIAHAWGVVEKMRQLSWKAFQLSSHDEGQRWGAIFMSGGMEARKVADTAPLAICRASLIAMESK